MSQASGRSRSSPLRLPRRPACGPRSRRSRARATLARGRRSKPGRAGPSHAASRVDEVRHVGVLDAAHVPETASRSPPGAPVVATARHHRPRTAIQRWRRAGALTTATSQRRRRALDGEERPNTGTPRTKLWVPSMGSMIPADRPLGAPPARTPRRRAHGRETWPRMRSREWPLDGAVGGRDERAVALARRPRGAAGRPPARWRRPRRRRRGRGPASRDAPCRARSRRATAARPGTRCRSRCSSQDREVAEQVAIEGGALVRRLRTGRRAVDAQAAPRAAARAQRWRPGTNTCHASGRSIAATRWSTASGRRSGFAHRRPGRCVPLAAT